MDTTRKNELVKVCQLIFYDIPVGTAKFNDSPIRGNKSLAQVIVNRIDSVAKNRDEFNFMKDSIVAMVKNTEGKTVSKIKLDTPSKEDYSSGLVDSKGFIIKKSKK